jgi:hypothetical protein
MKSGKMRERRKGRTLAWNRALKPNGGV